MAFHLQFAREEFAMAELTVSGKTLTQFWKPSDIYPVTDSVVSDKVTGLADVAGVWQTLMFWNLELGGQFAYLSCCWIEKSPILWSVHNEAS